MRNLIAFMASIAPLFVIPAGLAALVLAWLAGDWGRLLLVVLVLTIYLHLVDQDLRRY